MQIGGFRVTGFVAWLIWSSAHIYFLIGFRNDSRSRSTGAGTTLRSAGARLITGLTGSRISPVEAVGQRAMRLISMMLKR